MRYLLAVALVVSVSIGSGQPRAATISIVAFGDSNVYGSRQGNTAAGVPVSEAYPAKIERALRARGWDVSISNQGILGGTARDSVYNLDLRVPPNTKLTIVQFGDNDRMLLGASPADIAISLGEIIRRVRAKGSAVIVVQEWPASDAAAFSAIQESADAVVTWYSGLYPGGKLRPEYAAGDGAHLNAAGTDVIVARAVPDIERALQKIGFRPNR